MVLALIKYYSGSSGKKCSAVGTSSEIGGGQGVGIVEQLMRAHRVDSNKIKKG